MMNSFMQSMLSLLTSDTGSLVYHLSLAFSIAWALQNVLAHRHGETSSETNSPARRMTLGLGLLLLLQILLYVIAGLAWQQLVVGEVFLPAVERGVAILSLLVIIWLWGVPHRGREIDAAVILLALLMITLTVLGVVWSASQVGELAFNGSQLDQVAQGVALLLALGGGVLLYTRRTEGWNFGLAMMILLLLGHALHLLFPTPAGGDYPGLVRLAQMAAFPLLLILPQRLQMVPAAAPAPVEAVPVEEHYYHRDTRVLQDFLALALETDPGRTCQALTVAVARAMSADLALLVSLNNADSNLTIHCGYDLIRESPLQSTTIDARSMPVIVSTLQRGHPLRLASNSSSQDLFSLARVLDLNRAGNILAAPVSEPGEDPFYAIILLTPYSDQSWTLEEQAGLAEFSQAAAPFIQRTPTTAPIRAASPLDVDVEASLQALQEAQEELEALRQEREQIQEQLSQSRQSSEQEHAQLQSLAAILSAQENEGQEKVSRLLTDNEKLRLAQADLETEISSLKSALEDSRKARQEEIEHLKGQLRLALQEVSELTSHQNENHSTASPAHRPVELRPEELRGSKFRNFRMVAVDALVEAVVEEIRPSLEAKSVQLNVQAQTGLPVVITEPGTLHTLLARLLQNAGAATPPEKEVVLRVQVDGQTGRDQEWVLFQVTDAGPNLPQEDLEHLFSPVQGGERGGAPGTDDRPVSLASIQEQVDALGGRIWADNAPGSGATFTVRLPLSPVTGSDSRAEAG